eukprot:CAMPEP_0114355364 /NCGR_PEP_ID=MMETSP0101-20121206/20170_1 /TAXON_ID=38822 ORGANISM="Pteridomonas danica, Strain PT" /NCGR_SAMPLE_ID=MMETSP0101 /ASSEMBLY_ACC=CAM_ASM_000211 /LENGTH=168 /DNA_ID=CAMNT_0001497287 /DNA_START=649 /DNA_END=1155 /DNA_ORIENTATION=+
MSSVVMSFKPSSDSVGAHDTGGGPEDEEGTGVGGSGVTLAELDELAAALRGVFTSSLSRLVTTSDSVGSCESFLKVLRGGILTMAPSAPALETNEGSEIVIKSEDKMDETNIFLVNIFNQYKAVWKRNEEFQMIFDWYTPGSMNIPIKYHLKFFIAFPYCFILIKNVY